MKKILALALVLVLAIGMAVPTFAAKGKVTGIESTLKSDTSHEDDIHPGTNVKIPFKLSDFTLNDEAKTAAAGTNKSTVEKIIKTMEPRFRIRSGGQIFSDIYIDNVKGPSSDLDTTTIIDKTVAAAKKVIDDAIKNKEFIDATDLTALDKAKTAISGLKWSALKPNTNKDKDTRKTALTALFAKSGTGYLVALADSNFDAICTAIVTAAENTFSDEYDKSAENMGKAWTFDVVLETIDPWANTSDVDYEVDVYFLIDGKRTDNEYIHTVTGNFSNTVTEVNKDTYDVDSYEGQVIKATEYVPKIAIVGNYDYNVTANVKMAKDKKIYFYVTTENEVSDEGILDKYPTIEVAFKVLQIGLNSYTGNFIKLGGVDAKYYVYAKDAEGALKYLGRGGELLPLSAKYYVSTTKLDIEEANIDENLPTEPVPEEKPNYNPDTGI